MLKSEKKRKVESRIQSDVSASRFITLNLVLEKQEKNYPIANKFGLIYKNQLAADTISRTKIHGHRKKSRH